MLSYRATSSRQIAAHGTNFFTQNKLLAEQWALKEKEDGFSAKIYLVTENLIEEFVPEIKVPQSSADDDKCLYGHPLEGKHICPTCGE